jgi:hypothetical protein
MNVKQTLCLLDRTTDDKRLFKAHNMRSRCQAAGRLGIPIYSGMLQYNDLV